MQNYTGYVSSLTVDGVGFDAFFNLAKTRLHQHQINLSELQVLPIDQVRDKVLGNSPDWDNFLRALGENDRNHELRRINAVYGGYIFLHDGDRMEYKYDAIANIQPKQIYPLTSTVSFNANNPQAKRPESFPFFGLLFFIMIAYLVYVKGK